jgi:hypothetical protein
MNRNKPGLGGFVSPEVEVPSPLPPILPNNFVTAHFPETEAPARQKIKSPISSQFDIKKYVYGEDQDEYNPKLVNPLFDDPKQVNPLFDNPKPANALFNNPKQVNPLFDDPKQAYPLFDNPKQVNPFLDDSLLDKSNMDILSMIADITSDNYANLNSDKSLANLNSDKNYLNDNSDTPSFQSNKNFANFYSDTQNLNSDKNSADLNSDKNSAILNSDKNFVGLKTKNEILKQQLMELELALLDLQPQVSLT